MKLKEALSSIYLFIQNDIQINEGNNEKSIKCRDRILMRCAEFPAYIMEASLSLNYSANICNIFASMIFYFLCLDVQNQKTVSTMRDFLVKHYCSSENASMKLQLIDEKLTGFAQITKNINLMISFQHQFTEAVSTFISVLVNGKSA